MNASASGQFTLKSTGAEQIEHKKEGRGLTEALSSLNVNCDHRASSEHQSRDVGANFRETLIKAFPSPDPGCEAAFSLANPRDPPEAAKERLI